MTHRRWFFTVLMTLLVLNANALSQPHAPVVTMSIALSGHPTQELSAPESGLARITLKDGSEYGFRPTIGIREPRRHVSRGGRRAGVCSGRAVSSRAPGLSADCDDEEGNQQPQNHKGCGKQQNQNQRMHGAGCLFPSRFDFRTSRGGTGGD